MIVGQTTAFLSSATVSAVTPSFVGLCSRLAAPASVLVSAAPLPTIQQIKKKKNVGSLPLLPYSCMAANCVLWTTYGLLRHTPSIWLPNGFGLLLALYYIQSFIQSNHRPEHGQSPSSPFTALSRSVKFQLAGVGATVCAAALAFESQFQPGASAAAIADGVGASAVLLCIALFASPLSTVKTVVETKSADSIPLPFSLASLLCCFFWSVTGILELHDLNVIVPNALGFLFGLAQVGLKLLYSGNSKDSNALTDRPLLSSTEAKLSQDYVQDLNKVQREKETDYVLMGTL